MKNYKDKLEILFFQLEIESNYTEVLKEIYIQEPTKENYYKFLKQCFKNSNKILEKFLSQI
jgi:hypothetical protein